MLHDDRGYVMPAKQQERQLYQSRNTKKDHTYQNLLKLNGSHDHESYKTKVKENSSYYQELDQSRRKVDNYVYQKQQKT